jgi:hypothetical protein
MPRVPRAQLLKIFLANQSSHESSSKIFDIGCIVKWFHREQKPPRKKMMPTDIFYDSSNRLNALFTTSFNKISQSCGHCVKYYSDYYFGFILENKL